MKKLILISFMAAIAFSSCNNSSKPAADEQTDNPFFTEFETPFGVPDFEKIKTEHYLPAFEKAMLEQIAEINVIIANEESPSFENTIVAMDNSGAVLDLVNNVFFNLKGANTNDEMNEIAKVVSEKISKHKDDIILNAELFQRVKSVYAQKEELELNTEQATLLEKTYKGFVRSGANLSDEAQARLREINIQLSKLTLSFGDNMLAETNDFKLIIEDEKDLAGLPESVIKGAANAAKADSLEGKWLFTVQKPSMIPFLQFAENRELREKLHKAYFMRGDNNNENDNKNNVAQIVNLRVEKAKLLGFESHAHFILDNNMAKTPDKVYDLLNQIWEKALPVSQNEAKELQSIIDKEGGDFKLQPWDWWFYAEKLRKEKYALDEEELRPYFKLENALNGVFMVANKLYGIEFVERKDIPVYHKEVTAFEVKEADGAHIGIVFYDPHPRASKRGGAWMTSFRKQSQRGGKEITPVISIVTNFSKPIGDKPALLSFEEVQTLFHEFGHGLHGLLSKCTYYRTSGTSTPRDFVELPSQIMEHWAAEPEVLKMYAKHYETGEPIPDELINKLSESKFFNQGFVTCEFLAAGLLDMEWHSQTETKDIDVNEFEKSYLEKIGLIPEIVVRYRSTYFAHIFAGGYSAGYYGYTWAEVLDSDAFQAFKENGLFDQKTALAFRQNILEKGGTDDPMKMYIDFRGAEPSIDALLKGRGLK